MFHSHNGKKCNQDRVLVFSSDQFHTIIIAVFDGHGKYGHCVASFIRYTFLINFGKKDCSDIGNSVVSSLREANTKLQANPEIDSRTSGCTAIIGCLYHDTSGKLCYLSVYVGDSK